MDIQYNIIHSYHIPKVRRISIGKRKVNLSIVQFDLKEPTFRHHAPQHASGKAVSKENAKNNVERRTISMDPKFKNISTFHNRFIQQNDKKVFMVDQNKKIETKRPEHVSVNVMKNDKEIEADRSSVNYYIEPNVPNLESSIHHNKTYVEPSRIADGLGSIPNNVGSSFVRLKNLSLRDIENLCLKYSCSYDYPDRCDDTKNILPTNCHESSNGNIVITSRSKFIGERDANNANDEKFHSLPKHRDISNEDNILNDEIEHVRNTVLKEIVIEAEIKEKPGYDKKGQEIESRLKDSLHFDATDVTVCQRVENNSNHQKSLLNDPSSGFKSQNDISTTTIVDDKNFQAANIFSTTSKGRTEQDASVFSISETSADSHQVVMKPSIIRNENDHGEQRKSEGHNSEFDGKFILDIANTLIKTPSNEQIYKLSHQFEENKEVLKTKTKTDEDDLNLDADISVEKVLIQPRVRETYYSADKGPLVSINQLNNEQLFPSHPIRNSNSMYDTVKRKDKPSSKKVKKRKRSVLSNAKSQLSKEISPANIYPNNVFNSYVKLQTLRFEHSKCFYHPHILQENWKSGIINGCQGVESIEPMKNLQLPAIEISIVREPKVQNINKTHRKGYVWVEEYNHNNKMSKDGVRPAGSMYDTIKNRRCKNGASNDKTMEKKKTTLVSKIRGIPTVAIDRLPAVIEPSIKDSLHFDISDIKMSPRKEKNLSVEKTIENIDIQEILVESDIDEVEAIENDKDDTNKDMQDVNEEFSTKESLKSKWDTLFAQYSFGNLTSPTNKEIQKDKDVLGKTFSNKEKDEFKSTKKSFLSSMNNTYNNPKKNNSSNTLFEFTKYTREQRLKMATKKLSQQSIQSYMTKKIMGEYDSTPSE